MKKNARSKKAKYLATAGFVVAGLGLTTLSIVWDAGEKTQNGKWYRAIPSTTPEQVSKAAGNAGSDAVAVSDKTDKPAATTTTAYVMPDRTERSDKIADVPNDLGLDIFDDDGIDVSIRDDTNAELPAQDSASGASIIADVEPAPRASQDARDDTTPKRIPITPDSPLFKAYLQTATWQGDRKLVAFKPVEDTSAERIPELRTAVSGNTSPIAQETIGTPIDPASVVRITPVAGEADEDWSRGEKTVTKEKWYSSFWPLGHRVGVDKLKHEYVPFETEKADEKAAKAGLNRLPNRPDLIVELGDGFLDTGNLDAGFEVPLIGAVWQPRLWGYLINRLTVQSFNSGADGTVRETEVANRLDVFFNLQLTGTEKILLGLRPVDKNRPSDFSKYTISGSEKGFNPEYRLGLETLFFEGDVGSLFPVLDQAGLVPLDFGFTVGRQPLIFQEGILINDTIDAFGLIRNNIPVPGTSNFRVSGIWGWNRTDRNDGRGGDEQLFGLFTAADLQQSTVNLDLIYISDNDRSGDGLYGGFAAIQRLPHLGGISSAFRVNASYAVDDEVDGNVLGTGVLLTSELSKTVKGSDDIVYFNSFLGIGNFTQAGREAVNGGPLANTGILFASPNLSTYLAEINPFTPDDVVGGAIGYQAFWDDNRRNLILEVAGRYDLSGNGLDSLGTGFQLQQAVGRHVQLQLEGFYTLNEGQQDASGGRAELLFVL